MKRTALAALVCSAFLAWNSAAGAVSTENWEPSLKMRRPPWQLRLGKNFFLMMLTMLIKRHRLKRRRSQPNIKSPPQKTYLIKSRQNPIRPGRLLN